jgi:hypothetical protein
VDPDIVLPYQGESQYSVVAKHVRQLAEDKKGGLIGSLPLRRTFLTEGVHLYGQLFDFDMLVSENGKETEASHARVLQFLNMHYRVGTASSMARIAIA